MKELTPQEISERIKLDRKRQPKSDNQARYNATRRQHAEFMSDLRDNGLTLEDINNG